MDKRLQENLLREMKDSGRKVLLYLRNGVQMRGVVVKDYDDISILLEADGDTKLVYLSVLSTIQPFGEE